MVFATFHSPTPLSLQWVCSWPVQSLIHGPLGAFLPCCVSPHLPWGSFLDDLPKAQCEVESGYLSSEIHQGFWACQVTLVGSDDIICEALCNSPDVSVGQSYCWARMCVLERVNDRKQMIVTGQEKVGICFRFPFLLWNMRLSLYFLLTLIGLQRQVKKCWCMGEMCAHGLPHSSTLQCPSWKRRQSYLIPSYLCHL